MLRKTVISLLAILLPILFLAEQDLIAHQGDTSFPSYTAAMNPSDTLTTEQNLVAHHTPTSTPSYIIEESPGVKKLNVSKLALSPGTKLIELLELFPELLSREGDSRLDNYDVQVNGISTGVSREAALYQILSRNIESVVVAQSPSMAQQVKGQGAVINVILKPLEEGTSGNAALQAGTLSYINPSATVNYRKGKIALRSSLLMEYKHPLHNETQHIFEKKSNINTSRSDTVSRHYGYELARIQLDCDFNPSNSLKAWAWESYAHNKLESQITTHTPITFISNSLQHEDRFNFAAGASFRHNFKSSAISTQLEYSNAPATDNYQNKVLPGVSTLTYTNHNVAGTLSGYTSYTLNFGGNGDSKGGKSSKISKDANCSGDGKGNWDSSNGGGDGRYSLTAGVNYSYSPVEIQYAEDGGFGPVSELDTKIGTFYLSPYAEVAAKWNKVELSGGARYQMNRPEVKVKGSESYTSTENNATAFIKFGWQLKPHHYLNAVLDRSAIRPDARKRYPFKYYDPAVPCYVQGNENLRPMGLHNASLGYIFDLSFGSKGSRGGSAGYTAGGSRGGAAGYTGGSRGGVAGYTAGTAGGSRKSTAGGSRVGAAGYTAGTAKGSHKSTAVDYRGDAAGYTAGTAEGSRKSTAEGSRGGSGAHTLVASATMQYIKANDIICTTYSDQCTGYINDGSGDILSANAMMYYSHGIFSTNLNFNIFQNWTRIRGASDSYFYYNISLVGVFSLPKGWRITPKLIYHSKIITNTSKLGDYLFAQLNLSKTWGRWSLYAEYQDIFHTLVEDKIQEGTILHTKTYSLRHPNFLLGAIFSF